MEGTIDIKTYTIRQQWSGQYGVADRILFYLHRSMEQNAMPGSRLTQYMVNYSYSARKVVEYTSSILKCWLNTVTSSKEYGNRGKKQSNITLEKPDKQDLSWEIKVNINSDKPFWYYGTLSMAWWKWHFTLWSPPKTHDSSLTMGKTSDKPHFGDILQTTWASVFKAVNVIKSKTGQRDQHNQEERQEQDY